MIQIVELNHSYHSHILHGKMFWPWNLFAMGNEKKLTKQDWAPSIKTHFSLGHLPENVYRYLSIMVHVKSTSSDQSPYWCEFHTRNDCVTLKLNTRLDYSKPEMRAITFEAMFSGPVTTLWIFSLHVPWQLYEYFKCILKTWMQEGRKPIYFCWWVTAPFFQFEIFK